MAFGLSVLLFVVSLFAIVMIHEGGHYLGARLYNFRVLEYFLGFGPRLWSFRRGEIEYGVKAIPAGGYVKIAGMNPFENDVPEGDEHRAYGAKPVWQRIIVILAGPMSHFLVAWLIFAAVFMFAANWNIPGIVAVTPKLEGATVARGAGRAPTRRRDRADRRSRPADALTRSAPTRPHTSGSRSPTWSTGTASP